MLKARAGVDAVILEDGNVGDARVEAELVIARFVGAQDIRDVGIGHQRHRLRVVRRLDDHVVHTEALDRAA